MQASQSQISQRAARPAWLLFIGSVAVSALFGAACSSDDGVGYPTGPKMRPGENCLACHSPGFGDDAPTWSAGGTIYPNKSAGLDEGISGVKVTVTDSLGQVKTAKTNSVGNFYMKAGLVPPYRVSIEYKGEVLEMPEEAPAGACNSCHSYPDPNEGAPGRIFIPQGRGDWVPKDAGVDADASDADLADANSPDGDLADADAADAGAD